MKQTARIIQLVILIFLIVSCDIGYDKINDIKQHPRDYVGKDVKIKGNVKDVYSFFFASYFVIDDGTDSIYVVTTKPLPTKGERLTVEGSVDYFTFGTIRTIVIEEKDDEQ